MGLSLKQSLQQLSINLNGNFLSLHPGSTLETVPSRSLSQLLNDLKWPLSYSKTATNHDYPSDREPGWSNDIQGLTHDDSFWYVMQTNVMWQFPVARDLNTALKGAQLHDTIGIDFSVSKPEKIVGLRLSDELRQKGYYHLGDGNYSGNGQSGKIYIPIESKVGKPPLVAVIGVSGQSISGNSDEIFELSQQFEAPWCASNPRNRLLYSSNFEVGTEGINAYRIRKEVGSQMTADFVGRVPLLDTNGNPRKVSRVQGGVFSSNGHLYLVSDDGTGILGFDMFTGRQSAHIPVDYQPKLFGQGPKEEIEAITIWDLDFGQSPNISGQIHLMMIDNFGSGQDDLYFKHYKVNRQEDKSLI